MKLPAHAHACGHADVRAHSTVLRLGTRACFTTAQLDLCDVATPIQYRTGMCLVNRSQQVKCHLLSKPLTALLPCGRNT